MMDGGKAGDSFFSDYCAGKFCPLHSGDNHFSHLIRSRNGSQQRTGRAKGGGQRERQTWGSRGKTFRMRFEGKSRRKKISHGKKED